MSISKVLSEWVSQWVSESVSELVTRSPVELLWTAKNKKQWHPSGFDTGGVMRPKETERRQCSTRQVFKAKMHKDQQKKRKEFALHRSRPSSSLQSKGLWGWTSTSRLSTVLYKGKVICALNDVFIQTARTLSEGDESCSWPTSLELEQMARDAEEAQGCSEGLP